jgi:hypothetical protein
MLQGIIQFSVLSKKIRDHETQRLNHNKVYAFLWKEYREGLAALEIKNKNAKLLQ